MMPSLPCTSSFPAACKGFQGDINVEPFTNNIRIFSVIPLFLLLVIPLSIGTASSKDRVANKLEPYTVLLKNITPSECQENQFKDLTIQKFEQSVCIFHNSEEEQRNEPAIDLLQQAQLKGLPPVHQNFAALMGGLLHCRQANIYLQRYKESENKSHLPHDRFCRARSMSLASFSDVDWQYSYFDYEQTSRAGFNLNARLEEMSSCYGGVLDPAYNAECGLISNISEQEVETLVEKAVAEVIEKYFEGAESPITAMFVRKSSRAEGLLKSAEDSIEDLENKATLVNKKYQAFQRVYDEAKEEKIERIYADYRTSVLKANSIMDEFDRWKGGLFITSEHVNLLPKISERKTQIQEELERITKDQFQFKAESLASDIENIIDGERRNKEVVDQLCRIYFCEFLNKRVLEKTMRICRQPRMQNNPLCVGPDENLRPGILKIDFNGTHEMKIAQMCTEAGLEPQYAKVGLGRKDSNLCLQSLP